MKVTWWSIWSEELPFKAKDCYPQCYCLFFKDLVLDYCSSVVCAYAQRRAHMRPQSAHMSPQKNWNLNLTKKSFPKCYPKTKDWRSLSDHRCSILTKCKIRSNSGFSTLVRGVSEASVDRALFFLQKNVILCKFF